MKNIRIAGLFAAGVLLVGACSNGSVVNPTDDGTTTEFVTQTEVVNELTAEMQFEEGSIANEVRERPSHDSLPKRGPGRMFDKLLRALQLSEEQVTKTQELLTEHKACVDGAVAALRTAERALVAAAEAERAAIKEKAAAGEITREEAAAAIKAVNQRLREALRALPERKGTREAIRNCNVAFTDALATILTDEQQATLKRWLAAQVPPPRKPGDGPGRGPKPDGDSTRGGKGPGNRPVPDSTRG